MENKPEENKQPAKKPAKPKGPIRTEAVIPFLLVVALTWAYFFLFFDLHLKKALELAGYHVVGAEVDIGELRTSFWNGSFRAQNIQVTNSQKPSHDMVKIGDIRFGILWDGLLRAKFIVDEMAVEQIEIDVPRKSPGKVKPPEPIKPEDKGPSAAEKLVDKLKDKALGKVEDKYQENVLGNLAAILKGDSADSQLKSIENSLGSKEKIAALDKQLKEKSKMWEEKFKTIPKPKEIQALGDRLGKVKIKDFKTPQELQQSLGEIDSILKEADSKYKDVQNTGSQFQADLKATEQQFKELEQMVKNDIKDLETRFKIPQLDAKSLSQSIFSSYLDPYKAQFFHYSSLAKKYAPPKLLNKGGTPAPDNIKPHPREKGVVYEFPRTNSYPLFWIKKISVSSKANKEIGSGNLQGSIVNITSNQKLINAPTKASFQGDFPGFALNGLSTTLIVDSRKEETQAILEAKIASLGISEKTLTSSPDVTLGFQKAQSSSSFKVALADWTNYNLSVASEFKNVDYAIEASNKDVKEALTGIFKSLPPVTLNASGSGQLPDLNLSIESNLGSELGRAFSQLLQAKINEAKKKLQAIVDAEIGKNKEALEKSFAAFKNQFEGEIKRAQDQLNGEKSKGEAKINSAKKDAENQAKKGLEAEVKKALGSDGDKKLDDLKKKFGL